MSTILDDIRQRVSLVEVVSRYVPLKPAGKHFRALCPFHPEKTPSFWVSPEKGLAYCFGCHRGGDIFKFLQEIDGLTFPEAVKKMADEAGIEVPKGFSKDAVPKKEKDRICGANTAAAKFFHEILMKSAFGEKARHYLEHRGVSQKTMNEFLIGFSPDSFVDTQKHLVNQDFTHDELLKAGLITPRNIGQTQFMDRFRRRIMFPVHNLDGDIVGFGARAIDPDDQPKYLNTAETILFHKGRVLYGLHAARQAIRAKKQAILVEGYMDVIACHQAGITNVVATNGTALTREHASLLKRFTRDLVLSFDMDIAGQEAAYRALSVVQGMDFELSVLALPEGKDPDECLRKNPHIFHEALQKPQPFVDYFLNRSLSGVDPTSLAGKNTIFRAILPLLHLLEKAVERDHYIRLLSDTLLISTDEVYDAFTRFKLPETHPARDVPEETIPEKRYPPEEYLLGLLLQFPAYLETAQHSLSKILFPEPIDFLYKAVFAQYNFAPESSSEPFLASFPEELQERLRPISLYAAIATDTIPNDHIAAEVHRAIDRAEQRHLERKRSSVYRRLKQASISGDSMEEEKLFTEYNKLLTTP